jgi:guanine nucleotide-binding protein subunit alpha
VLKQMRVIHAGGFNKTERKQWRVVIFNNLVNAFQVILGAMEEQRTEFEDDDNIVSVQWRKVTFA